MANDVVIKVENVKKTFHLPHQKSNMLKHDIIHMFKKKDKTVETYHALKDISFEVKKGEFLGILGRNGSGKSTLLKILSQIYQPNSGKVSHRGKLVPFIELGVGFKPELTGRENVYLNGALLGFSTKEIDERYDEIVEFAELEEFMDQKLKNYSSGMKVRLAFSVAIRADADILLLDEVLAVGDAAFQRKCNDYFQTLKDDNKTIILVTHNMGAVKKYCNRAILIDDGHIKVEGDPEYVAEEYNSLFSTKNKTSTILAASPDAQDKFDDIKLSTKYHKDAIRFNMSLRPSQELEDPIIALLIYKGDEQVYRWVSDENTDKQIFLKKGKKFEASLEVQNIFPVGKYTVSLAVRRRDRGVDYGVYNNISDFEAINHSEHQYRKLWRPNENFTITKGNDVG